MIQSQIAEVYTVEHALATHFSSRAIQRIVHSILSLGGGWRPFLTDQTEQRSIVQTPAFQKGCQMFCYNLRK